MRRTYSQPCGCGKKRYRTYDAALRTLLNASRKRGTPLRIYRCPVQPGWHMTKLHTWEEREATQ